MDTDFDKKKSHRPKNSGRKAEKKTEKNKHQQDLSARQRNPKAFAFHSAVRAQKKFIRSQDVKSKRYHVPVVDRTPLDPPPVIVAVVGGPKAGKSTLLRCLIKNYTRQKLSEIQGPVTIVTGKKQRLTFVEVNSDINCMIDVAKVADIVLLLIDATFGIEMEVFEFLEICRAHGSPRIMGVLNHLDLLKNNKALRTKKKLLKHRFQVELYPGAKLFYLSGIIHGEYLKNEVSNLGRFISVMKFRPLQFRSTHPHILVDRWEDISDPEELRLNSKNDRNVVLYGYVRGTPFREAQQIHIPGCGDFQAKNISLLPDPCPLPEALKKRALNTKERCLYAPMSGVAGVLYDKDAVYIDLGTSHHGKENEGNSENAEKNRVNILDPLLELQTTTDQKTLDTKFQVFDKGKTDSDDIEKKNFHTEGLGNLPDFESITGKDGVTRRRVIFKGEDIEGDDDDESDDSDEEIEDETEDSSEDEDETKLPKKKKLKSEKSLKLKGSSSDDDSDIDEELKMLSSKTSLKKSSVTAKTKENSSSTSYPNPVAKPNDVFDKVQQLLKTFKAKPSATNDCSNESDYSEGDSVEGQISKDRSKTDSGFENASQSSDCESSDNEYDDQANILDRRKGEVDPTDKSEDHSADTNENEDDFRLGMFREASNVFFKNQSDISQIRKYIYGEDLSKENSLLSQTPIESGGLFASIEKSSVGLDDLLDSERSIPNKICNWEDPLVSIEIRDCFVTGKWAAGESAQALLKMDEEDEDLYGDFEDLEKGEVVKAKEEAQVEAKEELKTKANMTVKERRIEKKRRLKEMFDSEYDTKGDDDYYDGLKSEMKSQAELNRNEFEGLDDQTRVQYEGFRAGLYIRLEIPNMPCEFAEHFDPTYPVIVGGLLENEQMMGYVKARLKVHRWYPRILKNRDPLIMSLGWRRFQSLMYYFKKEDNFRQSSLKYARKFIHVEAQFWGPISPISHGFVALQNISNRVPTFRIAANGVILETDKSTNIVKKLKLIGYPEKVFQKTAFIKSMFHSDTEVVKFVGAKLMTQSGIRGIVKKSMGPDGNFRATFEDKISMSDIVILRSWAAVNVTPFCSYIKSLLLPKQEKELWKGMRTVGEVKKELNIKNTVDPDHLYTEITERKEYVPMPLKIPKDLQRALPYKDKPKFRPKTNKKDRVIVVKDPEEEKMDDFVIRLRTLMNEKRNKENKEHVVNRMKHKQEVAARVSRAMANQKKKKAYACKSALRKTSAKSRKS